MFPIAWAIMESENKSSWIWFINALQNQLGTTYGSGFTIVSDQQKRLVEALHACLPNAEHQKCARQVHAHFREKHKMTIASDLYWEAVYSLNEPDWR
ncbi:unnamed protein product, partial [Linum tenue]